jgi:hypothetical protein
MQLLLPRPSTEHPIRYNSLSGKTLARVHFKVPASSLSRKRDKKPCTNMIDLATNLHIINHD